MLKFALVAIVAVAVFAATFSASGVRAADNADVVAALYNRISQTTNISGMSLSGVGENGFLADISGAFGTSSGAGDILYPGTRFRAGNAAEIFVATAIFKMIADGHITIGLDDPITSTLLPGSITFAPPAYTGTSLTLRMLLQHTSTLQDTATWTSATTTGTVTDFATWALSYFVSGSAVSPSIWTGKQPGVSASYNYAKANIGLLMYIIERVVANTPTLVTSSEKTCLAYVAEKIWLPLGMSNTFVRGRDGSLPVFAATPAGVSAVAANSLVIDNDGTSTIPTARRHPVYFAEEMTYTTTDDLSRLAKALFVSCSGSSGTCTTTAWLAIGNNMKQSATTLSTLSTTETAINQKGYMHGMRTFDGTKICALATASTVVKACPMTSATNVWGVIFMGTYQQVMLMCSDGAAGSKVYCTATATNFNAGRVSTSNSIMTTGGVAAQLSYGTQTSGSSSTSATTDDSLYALWVVLAVIGCLLFVFIAAFIAEFMVGEAPVASGLVMPTNAMPQVAKA